MMKNKVINGSIFMLSSICLIISCKLFWNLGVYVDEFNTSPAKVLGGELWLYMNWFQLVASVLICILSSINLLKTKKN